MLKISSWTSFVMKERNDDRQEDGEKRSGERLWQETHTEKTRQWWFREQMNSAHILLHLVSITLLCLSICLSKLLSVSAGLYTVCSLSSCLTESSSPFTNLQLFLNICFWFTAVINLCLLSTRDGWYKWSKASQVFTIKRLKYIINTNSDIALQFVKNTTKLVPNNKVFPNG